jgi:hypothetical protein
MKTKVLEEIKNRFETSSKYNWCGGFAKQFFFEAIEKSLEEIELETAITIATAARKAGLVPKDLAEYKDWEKSLTKHIECDKCCGKGYRTELKGVRELSERESRRGATLSDNSGKQVDSFISSEYCDCDRGKELAKHTEDTLKERVEEVIKDLLPEEVGKEVTFFKNEKTGVVMDWVNIAGYNIAIKEIKSKAKERYNINI